MPHESPALSLNADFRAEAPQTGFAQGGLPLDTGMPESAAFLSSQLITYIGNKRALLDFIGRAVHMVRDRLGKPRLDVLDVFSGSGVVSRYLKQFADKLVANDLESYSRVMNRCYLSNRSQVDEGVIAWHRDRILQKVARDGFLPGFIQQYYAPQDDFRIQPGERVFFTSRNARFIDTVRQHIDAVPDDIRDFLLAPLLVGASVHNNTSGVFKGFYKNSETGSGQFGGNNRNALKRILGNIELAMPVFSNYTCDVQVSQADANTLVRELGVVDLAYLDPPYNQHPYGANYFMLNLIVDYREPAFVSRVSGIPDDWNRSRYNSKAQALGAFSDVCAKTNARFLLVSFNSEGFIGKEQMVDMLSRLGRVRTMETPYNTFKGSRNLRNRATHVKEYLYLVERD
jgi:adenine-specific DNA-methyltransferase